MKSMVVYDSNFGNTKMVAEVIALELNTRAILVSNFDNKLLKNIDLLVAGSPIIGWKPSERMGKFLNSLKPGQLKGIKAISFDTRVNLFIHGDATKKISKKMEEAGAKIIAEPNYCFVKGKEGPLVDGEVEKAIKWIKLVKENYDNV